MALNGDITTTNASAGAIVGENAGTVTSSVSSVGILGLENTTPKERSFGGIAAVNNVGIITNSYSSGSIHVKSTTPTNVGGIVGLLNGGSEDVVRYTFTDAWINVLHIGTSVGGVGGIVGNVTNANLGNGFPVISNNVALNEMIYSQRQSSVGGNPFFTLDGMSRIIGGPTGVNSWNVSNYAHEFISMNQSFTELTTSNNPGFPITTEEMNWTWWVNLGFTNAHGIWEFTPSISHPNLGLTLTPILREISEMWQPRILAPQPTHPNAALPFTDFVELSTNFDIAETYPIPPIGELEDLEETPQEDEEDEFWDINLDDLLTLTPGVELGEDGNPIITMPEFPIINVDEEDEETEEPENLENINLDDLLTLTPEISIDEDGNLQLDENGNPIVIHPEVELNETDETNETAEPIETEESEETSESIESQDKKEPEPEPTITDGDTPLEPEYDPENPIEDHYNDYDNDLSPLELDSSAGQSGESGENLDNLESLDNLENAENNASDNTDETDSERLNSLYLKLTIESETDL
ncbi:MAG: hypothetical protein FWG64_09465 [Firmicutes bacterium]|nr:hypothetical protein [Bacillota bacterium]